MRGLVAESGDLVQTRPWCDASWGCALPRFRGCVEGRLHFKGGVFTHCGFLSFATEDAAQEGIGVINAMQGARGCLSSECILYVHV